MTLYTVVVHMPHQSVVCPFSDKQLANDYFVKLLKQCFEKYGNDVNGGNFNYCLTFGRYEISKGYFVQLYEAELDREEEIRWIARSD